MSVRDGLLAVLSLGEAYGLQLHAELTSRAPHRKPVNVGQVYSTLDRLASQRLIQSAGLTADSLPLYRLTAAGRLAAAEWMTEPRLPSLPEWNEMLDQVLVTTSIDPIAARVVTARYYEWWTADLVTTRQTRTAQTVDARLALAAREATAVAAIAWLESAVGALADVDTARPLSIVRPRRGRRGTPLID